jgi:hypothetical protein
MTLSKRIQCLYEILYQFSQLGSLYMIMKIMMLTDSTYKASTLSQVLV